jgi:hypothetical protein
MDQNVSEILRRQLLLMGYKSSDTLSENLEQIKNKPFIVEQGAADRYSDYLNSEEGLKQHDIDQANKTANTYPNYCWEKGKGTILPGKNQYGLSGVDAIPNGDNGEKFCAYRGANNTLLFLPALNTNEITFIKGSEEVYSYYYKQQKDSGKLNPQDEENYISYLQRTYPMDVEVVTTFTVSGNQYKIWQRATRSGDTPVFNDYDNSGVKGDSWEDYTRQFQFIGYFTKDRVPYENPGWNDPRTEYQKFVDDWSTWIQIGAAVATAIAGALTGGAAWVLTAEIVLELGLGAWAAQREFERGDNISGTASLIFGLLPMLKLTKWFPGVSDEVFKSLSKKIAESGLESTDDVADYIRWHNGLEEEEQKLLSKLLQQDEVNRNKMLKEIGEALSKESSSKIDDGLKAMIKANPDILKDITFFNKLWVREIGTNLGVVVITTALQLCCSKTLNNTELMKLSTIYSVIPDSTKKLLTYNVVSNPELAGEIINNMSEKTLEQNFDVEKGVKSIKEWVENNVKESVEEAGGTYTIIDDPEADKSQDKPLQDENKVINQSGLDSLKKEGWMTMNEFMDLGIALDETFSDPVSYDVDGKEIWMVKKK